MRTLVAFVRLTRPFFLYGGFAGVALGAALAFRSGYAVDAPTYIWAQVIVTAFQLMVHYANDYFDRDGDRGVARTPWSGGSGVLTDGALPVWTGPVAAACAAGVALAATLRFALGDNPAAGLLGAAIGVLSWIYSAPPLRLAARGLGELDAALVVAVLVPAMSFAAFTGELTLALAGPLTATALAMFVMMLCVEIPDAGSDTRSGKRTLVVRLGIAPAINVLVGAVTASLVVTAGELIALRSPGGLSGVAPLVAGGVLLLRLRGDPRPASLAFWGVALYATTVTALAIAYATSRPL